jgi:fructokinase
MKQSKVIAGIGELLWDLFPEGKRLGGAPLNFSYHCHQLGAAAYPVSAVGRDAPGEEILQVIDGKKLPADYVETVDYPTGTVKVSLDEKGKPSYEICEGVAWDHIAWSPAMEELAAKADAVCFGSLAQRGEASRAAIQRFLESMRPEALKIFDVNLRQAFFSKEIIEASLDRANLLKLSDEELPVVADMFGITGSTDECLEVARERFDLTLIAYTRGPEGSLLLTADEKSDHPGCPGEAVNTVGAGDSFTAALCMGRLAGNPLAEINDHANRVASFVCSRDGATPRLPADLIP